MATALWRWISTDKRWKSNVLSRLSSVARVMRLPRSPRNLMPSLLMAPMVSAMIETNDYEWVNWVYFGYLPVRHRCCCRAVCDDINRYDCASYLWLWLPYVTYLLLFYGIDMTPSDRLPSVLIRPDGSLTAGMSARQTRSISLWCCADRQTDRQPDSPCCPFMVWLTDVGPRLDLLRCVYGAIIQT